MTAWNRTGAMQRFKQKLLQGMQAKGYELEFAERIYRQIEGFGEYGFPESHSASFALLTYLSSYLKCHWPAAFTAGLINSQPIGFYQPAQLLEEAKRQQIAILPVDVTASDWDCTLQVNTQSKHAIRLGMRLVRGMRKEEGERIMALRPIQKNVSVEALVHRASLSRHAVRALAACGAFRSLTAHRNLALWHALGAQPLPGMLAGHQASEVEPALPGPSEGEEILRDYRQLGLSTGRHPLALLRPRLRRLDAVRRKDLA